MGYFNEKESIMKKYVTSLGLMTLLSSYAAMAQECPTYSEVNGQLIISAKAKNVTFEMSTNGSDVAVTTTSVSNIVSSSQAKLETGFKFTGGFATYLVNANDDLALRCNYEPEVQSQTLYQFGVYAPSDGSRKILITLHDSNSLFIADRQTENDAWTVVCQNLALTPDLSVDDLNQLEAAQGFTDDEFQLLDPTWTDYGSCLPATGVNASTDSSTKESVEPTLALEPYDDATCQKLIAASCVEPGLWISQPRVYDSGVTSQRGDSVKKLLDRQRRVLSRASRRGILSSSLPGVTRKIKNELKKNSLSSKEVASLKRVLTFISKIKQSTEAQRSRLISSVSKVFQLS